MSSGISAAFSFLLPTVLHEIFKVPIKGAVATGFAVAYVINFALLRAFVFRSTNALRQDAVRYLFVNGIFRILEYLFFIFLFDFVSMNYMLAVLLVLATSTVIKFFGYRRIFAS